MSKEELIDIIDDKNNVVGQMTRSESYRKQVSHRVVHTMVIYENKVFIPRRSKSVSYLPGYFCSSAGGHSQAGEDAKVAALRELKEEIGLSGPIEHFEDFFFAHEFKVHVSLFIKRFRPGIDFILLDPTEVESAQFYTWDEIHRLNKNEFHPQLMTCLEKLEWLV